MSLRVWLPLTKDLRNQGLDDVMVTNNGATFDVNGKLGGCYSFGISNSYITVDSTPLKTFTEFSFACWVKIISWNKNYSTIFAVKNSTAVSWNNLIFSLLRDSSSSTLCFNISNGSNYTSNSCRTEMLSLNTWYHITCTYKSGQIKLYQDGDVVSTHNTSVVPNFSSIVNLWIGKGNENAYQSNSLLNDVRIYDHALSPMEVKQISQGLILHYPLNNVIGGLPRLWSLASYTRSIDLTTSYAYIYSIPNNTVWLTPGKQYTVAAEVKVNQNNILFYFDSNCTDANGVYSGNDAAQTVQYNPVVNLEKDKWVPVYITTTIKNDAGKPYYHHAFLFRTNSGTLTTNCEIRNIEVYEGNLKLRRGLLPINIIEYDTSGYCNNGMRIGTFSWTSDTPKYQVSTHAVGSSTTHLEGPPLPAEAKTVALWIKGNKSTNGAIFNDKTSGLQIGLLNSLLYMNSLAATAGFTTTHWKDGQWNHVVAVNNNGTRSLYVNGQLETQSGANNYYIHNADNFWLWNRSYNNAYAWTGDLSDFRIYTTALSADDVKSLYNNSAYIDNQGNIYGAVYEEV